MKILLYIVLFICFCKHSLAQDKTILINESLRCISISSKITNQSIKKGYITQQIMLKNCENHINELMLELPAQQFEKIYFTQTEQHKIKSKYNYTSKKMSDRRYYDRNIIFPISLKPNQISQINLYFKKPNKVQKTKALLWKKDAKIARTEALELTRGILYGILILFTLSALIVSILIQKRNYYYYVLYLSTGIIYLFVNNNLGNELLWPNYPSIDLFLKKIMLSAYLISSMVFLKGFIERRIYLPKLQMALQYFIYFSLILIATSLSISFFSNKAQLLFIEIQNIFIYLSIMSIVLTFIFIYFNTQEKSIVSFTLLYFLSFSFFLFYPQPEFGENIMGVYIGQLYTYSNAFIVAIIICFTTVYGVLQVIKNNEVVKKEMSIANSDNTFSIIHGQQNERIRVGRELHDGIGIMMSAIKMKMSSINIQDIEEANNITQINKDIDTICATIRTYSHLLLPPTLKKFGLQVALKDILEAHRIQTKTKTKYNLNIPDELTDTSQQLIHDIIKSLIAYFTAFPPDELQISIFILSSIKEAQIRIKYKGVNMNLKNTDIQSVITSVNLLQGNFQTQLINAWNYTIHIELPVLFKEEN